MKKILGLDLGTTSIGWCLVNEAENKNETSSIIKTGARVIPLTTDESADFEKGKSTSINADRTLKRGARRNLHRYKLRRKELLKVLKKYNIITDDDELAETGKNSTHTLWYLRAKSASEKISLKDFARVLLAINKKRGYKSNRKAKDENDGIAIDGMEVAKKLYENNMTPGQYALELLNNDKKYLPDFYRSDLKNEFDKIWNKQTEYYPEILTKQLKERLFGKNKKATWAIFQEFLKECDIDLIGIKRKTKGIEQKKENYQWRVDGVSEKLNIEQLAIVLQDINGQISNSSGYLGAISDRSKELYFNNQTVGQYLYNQIKENPHTRLKNQVFYRQDYLDEFEKIWETQAKFYPNVLTEDLKKEIRDIVIFYQRRLKSQKGLISICELEGNERELRDKKGNPVLNLKGEPKKKLTGPRVIPKSSPLFQEFKIWSILNNLEFRSLITREKRKIEDIDEDLELRNKLFEELNVKGKLSNSQILKIVLNKPKEWELNYKDGIEGNNTNQVLFEAYQSILDISGHEKIDISDIDAISAIFETLGIDKRILYFDAELEGKEFEKQPAYQLWHLLYSYEGDDSKTGNEKLYNHLKEKFGFEKEYAQPLVNITFKSDYGNLSSKAIRKILPYLKQGHKYSEAATLAGYNHSNSMTKDENEARELKNKLDLLPKNSLRNPVVEKILNQMVNVVNTIIDEYGKPDEIRIELARELKKSAKERADATSGISKATKNHERIRKLLEKITPFKQGVRITKKDIIKYKLYEELAPNGFKTIYTNTYVSLDKLFSKEFDIEHIIPKALLFDDSFSNKTLSVREFNRWKSDKTAIEAIIEKYGENSEEYNRYINNVEKLFKDKNISKAKYNKLLMKSSEIPDGFIERDLRNSQYIAKKAKQILLEISKTVVSTSGSITDKLRQDWELVDVMKELNWDKYDKLGLTYFEKNKDGQTIRMIKDWTKRNDHRHHAMDAITIAFTTHDHIQYLNNLNTVYNLHDKEELDHDKSKLYGIKEKITEIVTDKKGNKKRKFKPPFPNMRNEVKKHLENTLISFKAKNKVVTRNKNKIKGIDKPQDTLTPRGQLHKETIYGKIKRPLPKPIKLNKRFSVEKANLIIDKEIRIIVLNHISEYDNKPEVAFDSKTLKKNPILYKEEVIKEVTCFEEIYTIRKNVTPDLKIDKVIDKAIKKVLQNRLEEFGGNAKQAFSNLEENPIWLNKEKGIQIKRVTITGVSNAEALHTKKDHFGNEILDKNGNPISADFVSTGNNHHVAIYRDEKGNLQEEVVSFYDAVARINANMPIVWKEHPKHPNWEFLFTLKQNEMFVFPNEKTDFNPTEIDLMDENNFHLISPNLFRVQKISTKNYMFSHHLETQATTGDDLKNKKQLIGYKYYFIQTPEKLKGIIKVRINHIGKIVGIGEY